MPSVWRLSKVDPYHCMWWPIYRKFHIYILQRTCDVCCAFIAVGPGARYGWGDSGVRCACIQASPFFRLLFQTPQNRASINYKTHLHSTLYSLVSSILAELSKNAIKPCPCSGASSFFKRCSFWYRRLTVSGDIAATGIRTGLPSYRERLDGAEKSLCRKAFVAKAFPYRQGDYLASQHDFSFILGS